MEQKNYIILEQKKNIKAKDKYSHSFYKKKLDTNTELGCR